jgi:hypothetical protein
MTKPDDDGRYEWIYEDCCDIESNYVPPTEKGNEWCAATGGAEFYMGVNVGGDGAVVPIIPCESNPTVELCKDTEFECDEAIEHCGTPGTDSFVEDCAWATDIITEACCQAEQVSAREENPRERRERRCCFYPRSRLSERRERTCSYFPCVIAQVQLLPGVIALLRLGS